MAMTASTAPVSHSSGRRRRRGPAVGEWGIVLVVKVFLGGAEERHAYGRV